jgi:hypothetical protein
MSLIIIMKEKILLKLKEACGKTTSISDQTLDKLATTLATSVTEESQIDAVIELQKPILQAIDGNINHVAAEAVKKVKPVEKLQEKTIEKTIDPNEPEWFKSYREKQDQETLNLKNKLEGYEKEKTTAQLTGKVTAKLKEKGIPESYLKGRNLLIESEDGIDQLVTSIDGDYNAFKQEMTEQGVFISAPKAAAAGLKEGEMLGASIADKRNTGASEGLQGKKIV